MVQLAASASYIAAPTHANLVALFGYWSGKRGDRCMPARADIDPSEIKDILPDLMLWNVEGLDGPFVIRLVGERIVQFVGRNNTGLPAGSGMAPEAAASMAAVLSDVADSRAPRFRFGAAFWAREKSYRNYEAAFLPLSPDDRAVNMILGGITFDPFRPTEPKPPGW
jgi:hypothetical protein